MSSNVCEGSVKFLKDDPQRGSQYIRSGGGLYLDPREVAR